MLTTPALAYMAAWTTLSIVASSHVVLNKRDSKTLVGWVGFIWLVPFAGPFFYLLFGINRIHRRARALHIESHAGHATDVLKHAQNCPADYCDDSRPHLGRLSCLVRRVTDLPLEHSNQIDVLNCGDATYPAMVEAIDAAEQSVAMCTYIFDGDAAGKLILNALKRAVDRGIEVRLLVDDVGARYSWPTAIRRAAKLGIPVASFLPVLVPWLFHYSNLRNHRKILVVDGQIGFTGGLNIREEHCLNASPRHPIRDVHFRIRGAVVSHMQAVFARDWQFASGEELIGEKWFPQLADCQSNLAETKSMRSVEARGISDGPDDDFDKLRTVLLGAIAAATKSITIVTPYFLPDGAIMAALNVAAMRGVDVQIVLPEKTNLALVRWASTAQLQQLLERGCRIWLSPAPFDHSKLTVIDDCWSLIGSTNWDPRSLRLNFEFNIECYSESLASNIQEIADRRITESTACTIKKLKTRPLIKRLRDGFARVLTPYL